MMDLGWALQACQLSPMMGNFANMLWVSHAESRGDIKVTRKKLEAFNVAKRTSDRLLSLLVSAGLVEVERQKRHAPKVRLIVPAAPVNMAELVELPDDAD
jgi:hypothetical protein